MARVKFITSRLGRRVRWTSFTSGWRIWHFVCFFYDNLWKIIEDRQDTLRVLPWFSVLFFRLPFSWKIYIQNSQVEKLENSNSKAGVNKLTKSEFINTNIQIVKVPRWEFSKAAREQTPGCLCLWITTFSATRALQGIPTKIFTSKTANSIFWGTFSTKNYKAQEKHNSSCKPIISTATLK